MICIIVAEVVSTPRPNRPLMTPYRPLPFVAWKGNPNDPAAGIDAMTTPDRHVPPPSPTSSKTPSSGRACRGEAASTEASPILGQQATGFLCYSAGVQRKAEPRLHGSRHPSPPADPDQRCPAPDPSCSPAAGSQAPKKRRGRQTVH